MGLKVNNKISSVITKWLLHQKPNQDMPICDFSRLKHEVRRCDVILVEGRSRVSSTIKHLTKSPWSHAAIYVGRLHDIEDPVLHDQIASMLKTETNPQLIVESQLGEGTVLSPLDRYKDDHVRICRPRGLSHEDAQEVVNHALRAVGVDYNVRHIFDLMRFLLPWTIMPRRWGSCLFKEKNQNREICSSLIAEAFCNVQYPILPEVLDDKKNGFRIKTKNLMLFTPRDFDYSPFFEIIKYPMFHFSHTELYRDLPWENRQDLSVKSTDENEK